MSAAKSAHAILNPYVADPSTQTTVPFDTFSLPNGLPSLLTANSTSARPSARFGIVKSTSCFGMLDSISLIKGGKTDLFRLAGNDAGQRNYRCADNFVKKSLVVGWNVFLENCD